MLHQHRSSKRAVALLTALVLGIVAAASAQYVEPTFYGTPTYYYEPAPAYYAPESVPVYYSPEFVAPAPYYYIPAAPTTPYGETVAPTPYYYAPPVAPTPYGTPSPVAPAPYYYITPSAPTSPYGTPAAPAPYYYLTPSAPTSPYGTPAAPAPYYYIPPSAPTSPYGTPAAPAPYYYLTPSAPTTPYGTPAAPAPYYYLTPSAPTSPYGTPVAPTPYYYIPSVAPTTPYGPGPAAPTYYYTAPAPVTPYGNPVAPTYYYVAPAPVAPTPYAAPSTCPPCPTCEASSSYTTPISKMAISTPATTTASTEGTCYCPYDADWATWAIGDSSCRSTLYSKCKTDARLSCSWLDSYFDSNSTNRADFTRENEANIEAFLYNDCPPAAPCACAALEFTSKDSPASTFQCCKALKIYAKVPFSGLVSKDVDAYCEAGSIKAATRVAGWVKHALWHADCSVASTSVYSFKKAGDATATSMAASEGAALPKSRAAESDKRSTVLAAVFGAVGGVGLAAAAVAGWIAYKKSNSRYSMV